jgi:hypothetical protein
MFKTEFSLNNEVLQRQCSIEKLFTDAEFINDAFQVWVSSWLSDGPDLDAVKKYIYQVSPQRIEHSFKNLSEKNSAPTKGERIRGPVKHVDRAISKVSLFLKHFRPSNSIFLTVQRFELGPQLIVFLKTLQPSLNQSFAIVSHLCITGIPSIFRRFQEVDGYCQMLSCDGHN